MSGFAMDLRQGVAAPLDAVHQLLKIFSKKIHIKELFPPILPLKGINNFIMKSLTQNNGPHRYLIRR